MEKLHHYLKMLKLLLTTFIAWVRQRPRNAVISAGSFLLTVLGLILFFEFVFPTLSSIALIGFLVWAEFAPPPPPTPPPILPKLTLYDNNVCWELTQFMFDAISSISGVLNEFTIAPKTPNDLYDDALFHGVYHNAPLLKLRLLRNQKAMTREDLDYIKGALQGVAQARLRDGYLLGYLWATPASYMPLIKVAAVECSDIYVHLDILLTNTPVSVQAARLSDKPPLPPSNDDTDPMF